MTLDENAAAFGLFHLAFANLQQQLARVVFELRLVEEPNLRFDEMSHLKFASLRNELKAHLKKLKRHSSMSMEIQFLQKTCSELGPLAQWRNERAHPRVRMDENGIAIFDWRTGKPLGIHRDECVKKIHETIRVTVDLEVYGSSLARQFRNQRKIDAMIEEIFKTLEDINGGSPL